MRIQEKQRALLVFVQFYPLFFPFQPGLSIQPQHYVVNIDRQGRDRVNRARDCFDFAFQLAFSCLPIELQGILGRHRPCMNCRAGYRRNKADQGSALSRRKKNVANDETIES